VYQQAAGAEAAAGGNGAGAPGSGTTAGDDVIDAEFTESK
jgi:hypothetical protein